MRVFNKQIQTAVLLNTNVTGAHVPLKNMFMYSIVAIITGTPTGTLKLQASNDPETNDTVPLSDNPPVNWVDVANSSFSVSAAGNTMWNVTDVAYNYVRVIYTDSSGATSTAIMTVVFNGKGA